MTNRTNNPQITHGKQGFASMDAAKQREIAAAGGRASHGGDNHSGTHSKNTNSSKTVTSGEHGRKTSQTNHSKSKNNHEDKK